MTATILMYVKPGCPFCANAEALLTKKAVLYDIKDYTELSDTELRELDEKTNNWPTAPMIFINDKFIGGYDDLQTLEDNGALDRLLNEE